MACNGALVGLVSISGCCALVPSWSAVVIGIIGGWVYYVGAKLLLRLRIDDAVDAIPAHLGGGTWGLLATGLFANPHYMQVAGFNSAHPGWFYSWARGSGDANLLLCEFCHFLYTCTWVTVIMGPAFWICRRIGEFRVDEEDELAGLDSSLHGIVQGWPGDDDDDDEPHEEPSSRQFRSRELSSASLGFYPREKRSRELSSVSLGFYPQEKRSRELSSLSLGFFPREKQLSARDVDKVAETSQELVVPTENVPRRSSSKKVTRFAQDSDDPLEIAEVHDSGGHLDKVEEAKG